MVLAYAPKKQYGRLCRKYYRAVGCGISSRKPQSEPDFHKLAESTSSCRSHGTDPVSGISARFRRPRRLAKGARRYGDGATTPPRGQECFADLLLLDDEQAVTRARRLGFVVRRTPGGLALAKERGLIMTVKEHLAALQREGLWLDVQAYHRILHDVREEP
jgi:hypothetical protein